jgi:hypothetical protein
MRGNTWEQISYCKIPLSSFPGDFTVFYVWNENIYKNKIKKHFFLLRKLGGPNKTIRGPLAGEPYSIDNVFLASGLA